MLIQLITKMLTCLVFHQMMLLVSDSVVNVFGLSNVSNAECTYVQLNYGQIPKFGSKGIKFGHHNIRSLIGKTDEFRHKCTNVFGVIYVNKTLCDETVNDSELTLPGYNLFRCDRNRNWWCGSIRCF